MAKTKSISITASMSIGILLVVIGFFVIHYSLSFVIIPVTILGLGIVTIVGLIIIAFGLLHFFVKFW